MNRNKVSRILFSTAIVFSSLVALLAPSGAARADGNLVLNPGFETAGASAADAANWSEGTNHARASDKFHSGGWALHSTFRGAGTDTHTTVPITVLQNTAYTYSGYVWRTNTTGGACLDMNDIAGERQMCTRTAGSWQLLTGTWNSGSNTNVTLRLITDNSPTGDIWFDDIALAGADLPTNTPTVTPTRTVTATPTFCPQATPEPLWVEPVTSPTAQTSQVVSVPIGNGDSVTVSHEFGSTTVTGSFSLTSPALVTVPLQVGATHHLTVSAHVRSWTSGGCTYGGYTLTTTYDRLGAPLTIVQSGSSATNLVLNPGFETAGGSAADAANWTEGANHARASDKFHSGSWALHSTYRGLGTDTYTTVPIAVLPNSAYTYSGYIWRTNSTGGACMDMDDLVGERQLCTTTSGSWQLLTGAWNSGSNTNVTLRLITDGSPTGDIWFDDISLSGTIPPVTPTTGTPTATQTPAITPTPTLTVTPPPGNLVLNPGFETAGSSAADAANWTEGANHVRASDKFHAGGWALHSSYRGVGTDTHSAAPIAVIPNTEYTYSGYVWRTNSTGGACMDMNDLAGEKQLCTSTSGSWQYLSGAWNSGSNTSVTLRLITDGSPTGDIWFDDISLAGPSGPTPTPTNTSIPPSGDPVIAAAGDIACDPNLAVFNGGYGTATECRLMQVSDLLVNGGYTAVLPIGDISNADGALYVYQQAYDPTWGRVKSITHPVLGNHDYLNNPTASGYFTYFGSLAGDPTKGYYSYDIGAWHIVALNSMCSSVGGCDPGAPQEVWLRADLASHPNTCTLAYWHHPRFSSGEQGSYTSMSTFWNDLYAAGVEIVLNGHDHVYERYAPQNPSAQPDPKGIQEIISGTGGKVMNAFATVQPNSLVRHTNTFGVLRLTLHPASYDWQFVPEAGQTWTDSGSRDCFTP